MQVKTDETINRAFALGIRKTELRTVQICVNVFIGNKSRWIPQKQSHMRLNSVHIFEKISIIHI